MKIKDIKPIQYPFVGIWWIRRNFKYFYWNLYHRLCGPLKFSKLGKAVKFNGKVRVEHPYSRILIGNQSMVGKGCYFLAKPGTGSISIGENVSINDFCFITSCFNIVIGNNVRIAEMVSIRDFDHEFIDVSIPIRLQGVKGGSIHIGDDVWIGRGVMITAGVTIGRGCIIGANAVVTKSLPEMSVAVGVPARIIKFRN